MSDYLCPYRCSYRTNAGYCGYTGGHEACQYRRINGFDYESKQFYAEPVKTPEERYVWPPKTNGDMIRSKGDAELAKFIVNGCNDIPSELCRKYSMKTEIMHESRCEMCWLEWLKQEAID